MVAITDKPFTPDDFSALGLTPNRVRRLVAAGDLRHPFHGVYCPRHLPDSLEVRLQCVALVVPEHAVVSDLAAAYVWGIDLYEPGERYVVPRLDVVVVRGKRPLRRGWIRGGERDLRPHDVVAIAGVHVTTPVRTALDIACLRGRHRALAGLDAFMRLQDVTLATCRQELSRFGGRRGVTQARELVELATPKAESPGESWTRMAMIDAGFPAPVPQHSITRGGVELFRLDLAYPQWRIAVEYVGEEFHGPEQREHDEARIEWLQKHGWHVIVVDKEGLTADGMAVWLAELGRVIAERSVLGKRRYARGERISRR